MADAYGNILDPPGFKVVTEVKPGDILHSMGSGIVKKGVTIKKVGAGALIAAGTVLGRITADKKYVAYSNAAGDGTEVARGVLAESVDTTTGDKLGNIIYGGDLKLDKLTGLDSAAITDLNGYTDSVTNLFHF